MELTVSYTRLEELVAQLSEAPNTIAFGDVISLIDNTFFFTPTAFENGVIKNQENQNNGSCKLLALGQYLDLSNEQTLALFGSFYRDDVLNHAEGDDHGNIRNFMQTGHAGVTFEQFPLVLKG